jgi:hypothetical protein
VRRNARGGYYNPDYCARCGDERREDDLDAEGYCEDCAEIIAEEKAEENRPELFVTFTGLEFLFREFVGASGVRHGVLRANDDWYLLDHLFSGGPLDAVDAVPLGAHMITDEGTIFGQRLSTR